MAFSDDLRSPGALVIASLRVVGPVFIAFFLVSGAAGAVLDGADVAVDEALLVGLIVFPWVDIDGSQSMEVCLSNIF